MTDTVRDERDAFEAWYCADAAKSGLEFWPADIAAMRDGDEYGSQRVAINSKWEGWQARAMLAASPQGEGSSADAPIKPSADTGELRERVAKLINDWPFHIGEQDGANEIADAILDLIQSERGSPISQNDQPGLA